MSDPADFQPLSTAAYIALELTPAVAIPEYLTGEIQSKLAYVDEHIASAQVTSDKIQLSLRAAQPLSAEEQAEVEEKVQRVVISMAKGAIRPKVQVLEDHLDRSTPYSADPLPALMAAGQVSQEATGIFALGPLLSRLIAWFENQFVDLADSFEAAPYRFPTLIPARYLERVNYFRAFPHSLTFVTHLREDLDVIDEFSQHAGCGGGAESTPAAHIHPAELNSSMDSFARIQALLSPAVCYHLYFSLADKPLPGGQVVATAVGNCFRYEAINLTSLERMWNFTMREVIFVGSKDFVLQNRETARQRMAAVFERLGLAYRVESANDPFFIGEFRKQAAFQSAFQLKYEIRAKLPFKDTTLAVGSYNYHQDFFGRSLNITLPDGSPAHTGCVAFGLERIAFAFIAQFGLDPAVWPAEVREAVR
jgi:seryl-tRNA synthetase